MKVGESTKLPRAPLVVVPDFFPHQSRRSVAVHQLGRNEFRPYLICEMMHSGVVTLIRQHALDFALHVFGLGEDFAFERGAVGDPGVQRADAANRGVQAIEKLVGQTS